MSTGDPHDVRAHDDVHVVPAEMDGVAGLLREQSDHFGALGRYTRDECGDTSGLTNLMAIMVNPVKNLADTFEGGYKRCERRIDNTAGAVGEAKKDFLGTDADSARKILFDPPPGAHLNFQLSPVNVDSLPDNLGHVSYAEGYRDDWASPQSFGAQGDTMKIGKIPDLVSSMAKSTQDIYDMCNPGRDLVALFAKPIVGDYDLLTSYQSSYDNLANSTYKIAQNIRRGHCRIGPRWNGSGAQAFESEMLLWNQGTGGLGDAAEICSGIFGWLYEKLTAALNKVADKVEEFYALGNRIRNLMWTVDGAYEWFQTHGPATVKCVPGRPKHMSPELAKDILRKLLELGRKFHQVLKLLDRVAKVYSDAYDKAGKILDSLGSARTVAVDESLLNPANQSPTKWFETPELHNGRFDRSTWNPKLGAWRIALLPDD